MYNQLKPALLSCIVILVAMTAHTSYADSEVAIRAIDETVIIGRTADSATPLMSRIIVIPEGATLKSSAPNTSPVSWQSSYGIAGMEAYGLSILLDGLNTAGLSVALISLPESRYAEPARSSQFQSIKAEHAGLWILSRCDSVASAIELLQKTNIWAGPIPELDDETPRYLFSLHDPTGIHRIIAYINGKPVITPNPSGVVTESPHISWHLTNLTRYAGLQSTNASIRVNGQTVNGSGMMGLPGDFSSASRFVRLNQIKRFTAPIEGVADGAPAVAGILATAEIPAGVIRYTTNEISHQFYTKWSMIKHLGGTDLFFKSPSEPQWKKINLKTALGSKKGKAMYFPITTDRFADQVNQPSGDSTDVAAPGGLKGSDETP